MTVFRSFPLVHIRHGFGDSPLEQSYSRCGVCPSDAVSRLEMQCGRAREPYQAPKVSLPLPHPPTLSSSPQPSKGGMRRTTCRQIAHPPCSTSFWKMSITGSPAGRLRGSGSGWGSPPMYRRGPGGVGEAGETAGGLLRCLPPPPHCVLEPKSQLPAQIGIEYRSRFRHLPPNALQPADSPEIRKNACPVKFPPQHRVISRERNGGQSCGAVWASH